MKKFAIVCGLLAVGACSRDGAANDADNTARNARDRDGGTLTPTDQSESESDRRLTQAVRQALMSADLSVSAENIKIITLAGKVTLRGVVNTQDERDEIVALVKALPGVVECDDQLEVEG